MVQRAVATQKCMVCGQLTSSKAAMAEHTEERHGEGTVGRFAPAVLSRSSDQMEFRPCLGRTPWGKELR